MALLIIAIILGAILIPLGFGYAVVVLPFKGGWKVLRRYFILVAVSIDQHANKVLEVLFNDILITKHGHRFGNMDETISSALGRNVQKGTLTKTGKLLNKLLDKIDKDHAIKSIE